MDKKNTTDKDSKKTARESRQESRMARAAAWAQRSVKYDGSTTVKKTTASRKTATKERNNAIMGIGQLLVVVSIAYSTAVIFIGVDSVMSRVALLPQVIFASFILLKAFSRLYK